MSNRVKPGKAHPEQMSSAVQPITNSTRTSRHVSNVPCPDLALRGDDLGLWKRPVRSALKPSQRHRLDDVIAPLVRISVARGRVGRMFSSRLARFVRSQIAVAVGYLFKGATGTARNVIALEIFEIVRQVANGLPPEQSDPFDEDLPGG